MPLNPHEAAKQANEALSRWILNLEWDKITDQSIVHATGIMLVAYGDRNTKYSLFDLAEHLGAPPEIIDLFDLYRFPTTESVLHTMTIHQRNLDRDEKAYKVIEAAMNNDLEAIIDLVDQDEGIDLTKKIVLDGREVDAMSFAVAHKNARIIRFLHDCNVPLTPGAKEVLRPKPNPEKGLQ